MGNSPYLDDKDPDDAAWYAIDWANEIASDESISSAAWTVPAGITNDTTSESGTETKIKLSGGTAGTRYTLTCQITKDTGETVSKSIFIKVAESDS